MLIARSSLPPGMVVAEGVTTIERIPAGHKVAIRAIAIGEPIRRYGQIIGFATAPIAPGQHVHTQNCGMGDFAKDYAFGVDVTPTPNFDLPATFDGIRRPDGRVATRNYIGILTSVNCSAHVAGMVADIFKKNPFTHDNPLADFPNVDGVVALTHKTGCGMTQDEPLTILRRTLGGYARHANFSAVVVLGPGLRGQPDRRPDEGAEARRPPARTGNSGNRRHPQDRRSRRRLCARGTRRCQQRQARDRCRRAS